MGRRPVGPAGTAAPTWTTLSSLWHGRSGGRAWGRGDAWVAFRAQSRWSRIRPPEPRQSEGIRVIDLEGVPLDHPPALIRFCWRCAAAVATSAAGPPSHARSRLSGDRLSAEPAGSFTYAPGTRRYELTTVVVAFAQNQAGGRAPFEFSTTTTMAVTLTLARRARDTLGPSAHSGFRRGGTRISMRRRPTSPAYKGAKLTGLISPQGRIYRFEPPAHANGSAARPSIGRSNDSWCRFRVADIAPGAVWSDTTTTPVKVGGFETKTVAIMNFRIAADTRGTMASAPGGSIGLGNITIAGTAAAPTDTVGLTGDGTIRATDYVDGRLSIFLRQHVHPDDAAATVQAQPTCRPKRADTADDQVECEGDLSGGRSTAGVEKKPREPVKRTAAAFEVCRSTVERRPFVCS